MDTIDGMRVFTQVVALGSFSAAARKLGISKALASKYVGELEKRLGARLLNRTTRKLSPTEVGRAYDPRCRSILGELDELVEAVKDQHGEPRGLLRVAGLRAFGEDLLVDAVAAFAERYPEIMVDITLDERPVDIVAEGFDVAIRVRELEDSAMIARRLAAYPYFICASPAYLDRAGTPSTPRDLAHHDCVVLTPISPTSQWTFRIDGQKTLVAVAARARVNTARAAATLVRRGLGIGRCLYSTVNEDIKAGRLVRLLRAYEAYDRNVYAVYPHSRHLSGKVRLFVDFLLDRFRDLRTRAL